MMSFGLKFFAMALATVATVSCAPAHVVYIPPLSTYAADQIMPDMVPTLGAFAVVGCKTGQPIFRRLPPRIARPMLLMSWKASQVPAGTFLIWFEPRQGARIAGTLVIQVDGEIRDSGGCRVIDWTAMDEVVDRSGMLATMDGSRGGGLYTSTFADYTADKRGDGGASIVLCPTKDAATVEVFATHGATDSIHNSDLLAKAGTFTVDLADANRWFSAGEAAGDILIKHAPPPPVYSWDGPMPEPTIHKQERVAAGQ